MKKQARFMVFLAVALLLGSLLALVPANPLLAADSSWQATYWNNKTLTGTAVLQRNENELNHDWGDGSPDLIVNIDNFSARWTRSINFPTSSAYRFTATMDDGMRVYVDNVLIIDSWTDSQVHALTADVFLNAGDHAVKVEYYEAGGKAVAKLSWGAIGGTAPVPIANWKGEYFNNTSLAGNPVLVRDDASINFDWGVSSPAWNVVSADQFSARWTRTQTFDAGKYRFTLQVDDGARLWVNNQLIIDKWVNGNTTYTADFDVPSGAVPIKLEYFENVGGAAAKLSWVKLSGTGDWSGQYFNNKTLTGSPVLTRNDSQINFNWGSGSPAATINSDNFSARWMRSINFAAGRYRFTAISDDGVRMWVNGQLVIDGWNDHQPQSFSGAIDLPNGFASLQVEYYEAVGGAQIQVSWTPVPAPTTPTTPTTPAPTSGTGTVVSAYLNVRTGPGIQYSIITTLVKNQTVNLTGYRNAEANWVQITMPNGTKAWVSGKSYYLQTNVSIANMPVAAGSTPTIPTTSGAGVVQNAYYVNLRSGAGVGFPVITAAPSGTVVTLLGRNGSTTWLKLRLPNGTVGWMSASYVSNSSAFPSLPVLSN